LNFWEFFLSNSKSCYSSGEQTWSCRMVTKAPSTLVHPELSGIVRENPEFSGIIQNLPEFPGIVRRVWIELVSRLSSGCTNTRSLGLGFVKGFLFVFFSFLLLRVDLEQQDQLWDRALRSDRRILWERSEPQIERIGWRPDPTKVLVVVSFLKRFFRRQI
jgi:hypothetical protein